MITAEQAILKIPQLEQTGYKLTPASHNLLVNVLKGAKTFAQRDTFISDEAADAVLWIEQRLLVTNDLTKDQVNGIWGGSTTDALKTLCERHGFNFKGAVDSQVVRALVDGTKAKTAPSATAGTLYERLRNACKTKGFSWDESPLQLNIVGVRGFLIERGGKIENQNNSYNDTLFICYLDQNGKAHAVPFVASVDPGRWYQDNPLNPKGCAHLCEGEYDYAIGIHKNYRALVQVGTVTVERWVGRVRPAKPHRETVAGIGINIHAGTLGPLVENASAGCQVILSAGPQGHQWRKFMQYVATDKDKRYKYKLLNNLP